MIGDLLAGNYEGKYAPVYDVRRRMWGTEIVDPLLVISCSVRDQEYVYGLLGERIVIIKIDDFVKVISR